MASKKVSSISQAASVMGKKGGKKGGPARAKKLTPGERSAIARKGGNARHGKKD